jgi:hypothetical protein
VVATFLIPLVLLVWVHEPSVQIAILAGSMASTVALLLTEHFRSRKGHRSAADAPPLGGLRA